MTSLGIVFLPQLPPERLRSVARAADTAGVDELWLWEDCFWHGGIAHAAAALACTDRLRVGVGLLPVALRNVALTAMEVASLHHLFPGRPIIGIGHGVQDWMGQVGSRVESPMTLLREYVDALRALVRGERLTTDGRYVRLDDVALDQPPPEPPPIAVGAIGARTLELAGEAADGTILTSGASPEEVRRRCSHIEDGRARAGRRDPHRVTAYVHAATGPDAAARLGAEGRRWGYERVEDVAIAGDADAFAEGVRRWADAGVDAVVLQPTVDDPDPEGFVRFVGEAVRPLLR